MKRMANGYAEVSDCEIIECQIVGFISYLFAGCVNKMWLVSCCAVVLHGVRAAFVFACLRLFAFSLHSRMLTSECLYLVLFVSTL